MRLTTFGSIVLLIAAALVITGCDGKVTPSPTRTPEPSASYSLTVNSKAMSNLAGKTAPLQATPTAGKTFFILDTTVTNLNKNGLYMGNPLYFKLTTSNGTAYSYAPSSLWLENYHQGVQNTVIGEKVTGTIAFEIPQGATPTKLTYSDGLNGVATVNL